MKDRAYNAWTQKAYEISCQRRGDVGTPEKNVFIQNVRRVQKSAGSQAITFGDLIAFRDDYRQAINNIACRDVVFKYVQAQIL